MEEFTRAELLKIMEKASSLAYLSTDESAEKRAYERLSDAANMVDAFKARRGE